MVPEDYGKLRENLKGLPEMGGQGAGSILSLFLGEWTHLAPFIHSLHFKLEGIAIDTETMAVTKPRCLLGMYVRKQICALHVMPSAKENRVGRRACDW